MHLFRRALKELATPAVEERIAREDGLVLAILHEPANTVLGMTGCVEGLHRNAADSKGLTIGGCFGHGLAVFPADHWLAGELGVS